MKRILLVVSLLILNSCENDVKYKYILSNGAEVCCGGRENENSGIFLYDCSDQLSYYAQVNVTATKKVCK